VQTAAISRIIGEVVENGGTAVEVTEDATAAHNRAVQAFLQTTTLASDQCTSWFKTKPGGKVTLASGYTPRQFPLIPLVFIGTRFLADRRLCGGNNGAVTFWWLIRTTRWADWVVRRRRVDWRVEKVNVGCQILGKRVVRGVTWLALVTLAWRVALPSVKDGRASAVVDELRRLGGSVLVGN